MSSCQLIKPYLPAGDIWKGYSNRLTIYSFRSIFSEVYYFYKNCWKFQFSFWDFYLKKKKKKNLYQGYNIPNSYLKNILLLSRVILSHGFSNEDVLLWTRDFFFSSLKLEKHSFTLVTLHWILAITLRNLGSEVQPWYRAASFSIFSLQLLLIL